MSDLTIVLVRHVAHAFGWHSNGCRGHVACNPAQSSRISTRKPFRGWYRTEKGL